MLAIARVLDAAVVVSAVVPGLARKGLQKLRYIATITLQYELSAKGDPVIKSTEVVAAEHRQVLFKSFFVQMNEHHGAVPLAHQVYR